MQINQKEGRRSQPKLLRILFICQDHATYMWTYVAIFTSHFDRRYGSCVRNLKNMNSEVVFYSTYVHTLVLELGLM
jgi:hypothetical protein